MGSANASFLLYSEHAGREDDNNRNKKKKLETPQMANAQKGIVSPLLILDLRAEASKKDHNFFNGGLCNRYYDRSEQKPVKWPF